MAGLDSIARSVSESCSNVNVNSNTLLGIVKDGGIVVALCPTLAQTKSTTSVAVQSSTPAAQPAAVSVTIPTGGAGVTGGLGFKTTSTSTPIPVPQSEVTTSSSQKSTTTKASTTAQSIQSADGGLGGGNPATTSTTTSAKKTTSTASTQTSSPQSQDKSGGGSPFDVASNDATREMGRSMLALVVALFAVFVIGR